MADGRDCRSRYSGAWWALAVRRQEALFQSKPSRVKCCRAPASTGRILRVRSVIPLTSFFAAPRQNRRTQVPHGRRVMLDSADATTWNTFSVGTPIGCFRYWNKDGLHHVVFASDDDVDMKV